MPRRLIKKNLFQRARWKLTAYYVGLVFIVLAIFSTILIQVIDSKLQESINGNVLVETQEGGVEDTSEWLETAIYYVDVIIILIVACLGYIMAGRSLKHIKKDLENQKRFSENASHDLRNPLAIVITESEVALSNKHNTEKDLREVIQSNLDEAKKMSRLVNDLLLLSRNDDERTMQDLNFIPIDLHNFIDKIMSTMRTQAENKGLKFTISPYKQITINVDEHNFERVILNLLQNAINYTKNGSINVNVKEDARKAYIKVSDTGIGIDERDLPYVFDRFYKAEHSRNDASGSGLGLSISKQIIERMNGDISIKSKVGVGTTVKIVLSKV
ncbi:MAG: HAMP domain-containing sensor histidine kinase [bacterium]